MSLQAIQSIQAMLAPAVLMTTGAILVGGVQTMYGAVNDRMRDMTAEKLDRLTNGAGELLDVGQVPPAARLRVEEIDRQLPVLRARHLRLRDALEVLYSAIALVVVSMILIAVAITVPAPAASAAALIVVLVATVGLLVGLALVAFSVRQSVAAVDYEVERTLALGRSESPPSPG